MKNRTPYFILILCLLMIHYFGNSQILHVNPNAFQDQTFSSASHFNPLFIKRNKIRSIKTKISTKEDMQAIKETPLFHEYFFNKEGVLIKQLETYYKLYNQIDTILTIYQYTLDYKISTEIRKDARGYFTYKYTYDEQNRLDSYAYTKSETFPTGANEIIIFKESYNYISIPNDSIEKRMIINDIGKAYKEEGFQYNEIGRLKYKYNTLINSKIGKNYRYSYNDFGRVTSAEVKNLPEKKTVLMTLYSYDNLGNIMTEISYKDTKKHIQNEFLYDERLLLKAQLSKNQKTGKITIYKMSYTF